MAETKFYSVAIITERIIRDLSGGDIPSDSPYSKEHVDLHVYDALSAALKIEILQTRGQGSHRDRTAPAQFLTTHLVDVKKEEDTKRSIAPIPMTFLNLRNAKGIKSVSRSSDITDAYVRVEHPEVVSNLAQSEYLKKNGWYLEGMKVVFMCDMKNDQKVFIRLVSIGDPKGDRTAIIPVLEERVGEVIDLVKSKLLNRPIQDVVRDDNPNLTRRNG